MKKLYCLLCAVACTVAAMAQPQQADVQSPRAIIEALYQVISGEAGAPRNWERFLHLFAPAARLIPTSKTPHSSFTYPTLS
ncbi:MAG TPA: hypothetical protein PKD90_16620, partial [Phnomibacter sp.]|nr:hypothetical protein [Phnomibacter sp.]